MKQVFIALSLMMAAAPMLASAADPGVNKRQHHHKQRIEQGVRSGELTGRETRGLAHQQRAIRAEERAYKADGVLTGRERADLHRDLNAASKDVYRQKHDAQERNAALYDPGVNARQGVQHSRVKDGVQSGALTHEEAMDLRTDRREIRQDERAFKSDGMLTVEERKNLHQDLNQASKEIYQQKHDDEVRPIK